MNGRKERGIRRRYERIEGIVTQIFSSTRKLVTIYWELIRVRGGSYTEYVTRESEAKEKLALSSNDVRRERYHHLLDLVVVVDFSWCRKSRGRASISGSLSISLSLFFHFFPSSSLLVYIIPRNTLLFSFSSNAWPPSTIYFTSTLEKFCEKNMEKCWIPNGKIEEKRKIVWMVGEWDSNPWLFWWKTRTITTELRKHSSIKLLFYLYQLHQFQVISR